MFYRKKKLTCFLFSFLSLLFDDPDFCMSKITRGRVTSLKIVTVHEINGIYNSKKLRNSCVPTFLGGIFHGFDLLPPSTPHGLGGVKQARRPIRLWYFGGGI